MLWGHIADGTRVKSSVSLFDTHVEGEVRFHGAQVGGDGELGERGILPARNGVERKTT